MDKSVFVINAPKEEEAGGMALFVYRGAYGSSTCVFVDNIDYIYSYDQQGQGNSPIIVQGFVGPKVVISFPFSTPYLLIERDKVSMLTSVEAAERQKAEEDAVNQVWGDKKPGGMDVPNITGVSPGQYI